MNAESKSPQVKPPRAKREPTKHTLHGETRVDDYAWLRADNWREVLTDPSRLDPEILAYLKAENAYTEEAMKPTVALQEELFEEMRGRIPENDASVPDADGEFSYYQKHIKGGEYPIYCRHPINDPDAEEVLFDTNAEAKEHAYFHVGAVRHSPDHRYIACTIDTQGGEFYRLEVRSARTGELVTTPVERVQAGIEWANDSHHFVYVSLDDEHRADKVWLRALAPPDQGAEGEAVPDFYADPQVLYEQRERGYFVVLDKTCSKDYITIASSDHTSDEVYLVPADSPDSGAILIHAREQQLEYAVEEKDGVLLILTNADDCPDYKIMTAPVSAPGRENWHDWFVPPSRVRVEDLKVAQNFIAYVEREECVSRLIVVRDNGDEPQRITFEHEAYELEIIPTSDYTADTVRFVFMSPVTPREVYDYNTATRQRELRKAQVIPSGHDPSAYRVERLSAMAPDGEHIPMTVIRPASAGDEPLPTLVYGYGAYGFALPLSFVPSRLSLIDRGFAYVLAHVRGGKDKGFAWYRDGKLEKKANTITDFIAVLEHLCAHNISRPGQIAIQGGSAGGILVGAVANRRPDLLRTVIAEVPFVDVLNTMCDADLPLTPPEWLEWGNPIKDADAYRTIAAYSPYDNVKSQAYPDMLVMASASDPRVTYWEPAKWVARLRATRTDDGELLLKTDLDTGHGGASGRYQSLREMAFKYAFVLRSFAVK